MGQLKVFDYPLVHVEITMGLRKEDGTQSTTRDVTLFLQELNKERIANGELGGPLMTFKVFSGYAPYLMGAISAGDAEPSWSEITENVALLHLDYNPDGQAEERFNTLTWFVDRLMEKFGQVVIYAHFATSGGHRMLTFARPPEPTPEPPKMPATRYPNTPEPQSFA